MYKVNSQKKWVSFILSILLIFSLAASIVPQTILADTGQELHLSPYEKIITDSSGRQLIQAIYPLPPPKTKVDVATVPDVHIEGAINTLSNVPAFDWSYGCSATSAAMLFGYYDRVGYSNMYAGPTNSGFCPLDNSVWGHTNWPSVTCGECPLSATHQGVDGRAIKGHVDDYWMDYGNAGPDPYSGNWVEHTLGDCVGDYMGTNQAKYSNIDGGTIFYYDPDGDPLYDYTGSEPTYRDGCHGMRLFAQSRGYTVLANFHQLIRGQGSDPNKGFTFADFQAEIDAGRPVLIHVTGHTMLGYGYDTSTNTIYIHDTWDYHNHTMTWGGTYYGMRHRAVTVIRLNTAPPDAPSDLIATPVSSSRIDLTWQDNSSDETGFKIERRTGTGSYSQIATVGAGVTGYGNTGLSAGTTYYYRVRAYSAAGNSDYSNEASATTLTPPPPTITVTSPDGDETWAAGTTRTISWTYTGTPGSYVKIELFRDGALSRTISSSRSIGTGGSGSYSWAIPSAQVSGIDYRIRITSTTDAACTDTSDADFIITGPPPSAPALKSPASASTLPGLTPRLEWNASSGAVSYGLQVATTSSFINLLVNVAGITDLYYDIAPGTLNWNTTYYWRVNAAGSFDNTSSWSSYRYFKTAIGPPPNAPSDPMAISISSSQISLTWQDNSDDETGFKIERRAASGSYSQIGTAAAGVTSYSSTGLTASTTYYYRVRAYKGTLNSGYCEEASATTLPPPPSAPILRSPATGSTVHSLIPRLEWNASSGAISYGIQIATSSSFTNLIINEAGMTDLFYDVPGGILNWNTTYYWRVNAANSYNSTSRWSSYRYFRTATGPPPNAPSDLIATPVSSSRIDLTWQDNSDDETGFKIERRTSTGSYSQIATVGAGVTSYSSTFLSAGTTYYYRVRAYKGTLNSDYCEEALAVTFPPPPSAPILKSPASGSTVPSLTPRLEWNASSGAVSYGIQVATSSSFTSLIVNETGITDLYDDMALATLNWNTTYYWRVNAANSYGSTSSWSSYRYFRTPTGF